MNTFFNDYFTNAVSSSATQHCTHMDSGSVKQLVNSTSVKTVTLELILAQ